MQISKYNYSQNITVNKNNKTKTPNFKALIIEPNIKNNVRKGYHSIIDYLNISYRDILANYKHWDLKAVAKDENLSLILKHKKYNNEYLATPKRIGNIAQFTGTEDYGILFRMEIPNSKWNYFEDEIISSYDEFPGNTEHDVYLISDEETAKQKRQNLCNLQNKYYNALLNMTQDREYDYCTYPIHIIEEFEKASENLEKVKEQQKKNSNEIEQSFIVQKGDPQIANGEKPLNLEGGNKGFAKVAGMTALKETLREDIILPLQQVELYKKYGIMPANGIMLYGPPGTGKTFIAEALAEESGRTFLRMDVEDTESKYVGDTSKNIAKIFKEAEENAPSIIFIDELEALAPSRSKLNGSSSAAIGYNQNVNTLLRYMNNCGEKGIFIIAATNEPQKVDNAIRRAGRLDKSLFVAPPDLAARKELFQHSLENIYADSDIDYDKLASMTENYTAPEIQLLLVRQAALTALKQNRKISEADIIEQINKYRPQLDKNTIEEYRKKGVINNISEENQPRRIIGFEQYE
ncbi:ATP-binding protein [bacterium]|nr:ATP-binding protein [bacterium]